MLFFHERGKAALATGALLTALALLGGCGSQQQAQAPQAAQVKAMKPLQQDAHLTTEYAGQVQSVEEVKVQSRVSGNVVEKYIHGGDYVRQGQPLYKIDPRQYQATLLQRQATLAQSQASLSNAKVDLARYQELLKSNAIAEQTVTTQQANVNADQAAVDANEALVERAKQDVDDTVVYAPMDGKLAVDDVAVGTYATAGNTPLVTIGTASPVFVEFNISENDYLRFMGMSNPGSEDTGSISPDVRIVLSNGQEYPLPGRLVQENRALTQNAGTLAIRALFNNPNGLLLPGMFARVRVTGEAIPHAILVPQRAIQQLLGKSFVMVVGDGDTSEARNVQLGPQIGSYVVVTAGIKPDDSVIVEGLTNLQEGRPLAVTMVSPEEMGFTLDDTQGNINNQNPQAQQGQNAPQGQQGQNAQGQSQDNSGADSHTDSAPSGAAA